jgi:hypothetical protein
MGASSRVNSRQTLAITAPLALLGVYGAVVPEVHAEPEVAVDSTAQMYELSNPSGRHVLLRRRLTTTLAVAGYDLFDSGQRRDRKGPIYEARIRLRLDPDFGVENAEISPRNETRFVPALERAPIDLMYAYIEGRRMFGGTFGFRLGRQYAMDALGFWSFDGGLASVSLLRYVTAEVYGGLEVRGGFPFSTPRFERDGVWRGMRDELRLGQWNSLIEPAAAPALGANVEANGLDWLSAKVSYRKVYNTGDAAGNPFSTGALLGLGTRTSQERIAATLGISKPFGGVRLGSSFDLYAGRTQNLYASLDAYPSEAISMHADYDYYVPTFDADSIFNFFRSSPSHTFAARTQINIAPRASLTLGSEVRATQTDLLSDAQAPSQLQTQAPAQLPNQSKLANQPEADAFWLNGGGNAALRVDSRYGLFGARLDLLRGYAGHRGGGEITWSRTFERRYLASLRGSFWSFEDRYRPERSALSIGYVGGVGYLLGERSRMMVELEHNMNRLVGQRYRLMLVFQTAVSR